MSTMALPSPLPPLMLPPAGLRINGHIHLPAHLGDQESFRGWARSDECPEKGRFAFLKGLLWIDLSMEQLYTHNQVKTEIVAILHILVRGGTGGLVLADRMLLSHPGVGLSTVPDGLYVSYVAMQSGRVREVPNARNQGAIELEGSPEMVLEVVSDSSVEKDTQLLPPLYHAAGIEEFWRVDARGDLRFEILRWTSAGYVPTQLPDGWWRSDLFGRDFLLVQSTNPLGQPVFRLQVRP